MGVSATARCGCDLIVDGLRKRQSDRMTDHRAFTPGAERRSDVSPPSASNAPPPVAAGVILSAADYAELMRELDDLRSRHHGEVSQRLRDARDFGSPGDDDDRLAIREDAAFAEARIAQLEHLARFATVMAVDEDVDGVAGLGSVVRVSDELGGTMEFELVGRRTSDSKDGDVSLSSPVGKALIGVRAGDVARVALPSGEIRALSVLDVVPSPQGTRSDATAEAA
jgi:transcription elongation factor GreA